MKKIEIPKNFFTGDTLNTKEVALVHMHIQKKLIIELSELIDVAEDYFEDISLKDLKVKIKTLDPNRALSPYIFAIYQQLSTGLKNDDIEQVKNSLITVATLDEFYGNEFEIRPFNPDDYADRVTKDFIISPDGPHTIDGEGAVVEIANDEKIKKLIPYVEKAIATIEKHGAGIFSEFKEYARALILFEGAVVTGATSIRSYGNIYLRVPKEDMTEDEIVAYFVEHIVHEVSHLHLHALMVHDPMITNSLEETFEAPIRPDPRPMFGVFHATFVLTRMVRVFQAWTHSNLSDVVKKRLLEFKNMHAKGRKVVTNHGKLTKIGTQVFDSLKI